MPEHYFEVYLLFGILGIGLVYLGAYALLFWLAEQQPWRDKRKATITVDDATYHLKGYDAKPNIRRA
jgi:hypothetical protein